MTHFIAFLLVSSLSSLIMSISSHLDVHSHCFACDMTAESRGDFRPPNSTVLNYMRTSYPLSNCTSSCLFCRSCAINIQYKKRLTKKALQFAIEMDRFFFLNYLILHILLVRIQLVLSSVLFDTLTFLLSFVSLVSYFSCFIFISLFFYR